MTFKTRNPAYRDQPRDDKSNLVRPEYLDVRQLPSGKWDAFEQLVPKADTPARPERMICDCCMIKTDRMWIWDYHGFCIMFGSRRQVRTEIPVGRWGFCVYCWALFVEGDIPSLVARSVTLNPDMVAEHVTLTFETLAKAVYGEPLTWESGQPLPKALGDS